ncbi:hypothetical protein ANMWB30_23430 [Arthrobacter sp. MWB30]|nr:hypothetical protein ANMWB30_23430 [Arthrobacter sp. MWB30]
MAQTQIIEILDDLDGSSDASAHQFSLDGAFYEIDLSDENFQNLKSALSAYVAAARKAKSPRTGQQQKSPSHREKLTKIRTWATANGFKIAPRGRVPRPILDAYAAANS